MTISSGSIWENGWKSISGKSKREAGNHAITIRNERKAGRSVRFKDVFSIIGPGMVGPSSSHTAGAVRIGRTARRLFGVRPEAVRIRLFGSFAETYRGHGTDLALVAGLLDMDTDDLRIRHALDLAEEAGMTVDIRPEVSGDADHPNTAMLHMTGGGKQMTVTGVSIGGGNIEITAFQDFDVRFSAAYPTILILHEDRQGMIADLTRALRDEGVNIGFMDVDRKSRGGAALTVVEADEAVPPALVERIGAMSYVQQTYYVNLSASEGPG